MAIVVNDLIMTAREILTELPESVHFSRESLRALVKPAISLWQDRTNADRNKRQNFVVTSNDISIIAGFADIATAVDAYGFRLEYIADADIVLPYGEPNYRVKFVNSFDRLVSIGRQDKFFTLAYLSGTQITFREAGVVELGTLDGTFKIVSPVIPSNLATLNAGVMPEIAIAVADLARAQMREQNRGLNIPPK